MEELGHLEQCRDLPCAFPGCSRDLRMELLENDLGLMPMLRRDIRHLAMVVEVS